MPLKEVDVYFSSPRVGVVNNLAEKMQPMSSRLISLNESETMMRLLLDSAKLEPFTDELQGLLSADEAFRIIVKPVDITLPRPKENHIEESEKNNNSRTNGLKFKFRLRMSREELWHNVEDQLKLTWVSFFLAGLSAVVATIGLMRGSVALIIGAMILAPFLGPNVALSLGTTLGDLRMAWRATLINISGMGFAALIAVIMGMAIPFDATNPEIVSRTYTTYGDMAVALAAGAAGVLAFTTQLSATMMGVMVAVALLPPLAAFGMLLGAGQMRDAMGALVLVITNIACINLSGVGVFLLQGVRPRTWYESDRARKATITAVASWTITLILLILLITFWGKR